MSQPKVAALVLNYNGKDVTLLTLESLLAMDYPACDVVVVDNGSNDGSWEAVEEAFPQVRQVKVPENHGISFGMNFGLRWVLEHDHDYALILNNDIEVAPDMLTEMIKVAESDPKIGCVGPKSYYYSDRQRIWSNRVCNFSARLRLRDRTHAISPCSCSLISHRKIWL